MALYGFITKRFLANPMTLNYATIINVLLTNKAFDMSINNDEISLEA